MRGRRVRTSPRREVSKSNATNTVYYTPLESPRALSRGSSKRGVARVLGRAQPRAKSTQPPFSSPLSFLTQPQATPVPRLAPVTRLRRDTIRARARDRSPRAGVPARRTSPATIRGNNRRGFREATSRRVPPRGDCSTAPSAQPRGPEQGRRVAVPASGMDNTPGIDTGARSSRRSCRRRGVRGHGSAQRGSEEGVADDGLRGLSSRAHRWRRAQLRERPPFERVLQFPSFQSSLLRRVAVVQLQEAPVGGAEVVEVVELVALVAKSNTRRPRVDP